MKAKILWHTVFVLDSLLHQSSCSTFLNYCFYSNLWDGIFGRGFYFLKLGHVQSVHLLTSQLTSEGRCCATVLYFPCRVFFLVNWAFQIGPWPSLGRRISLTASPEVEMSASDSQKRCDFFNNNCDCPNWLIIFLLSADVFCMRLLKSTSSETVLIGHGISFWSLDLHLS